MLKHKKYISQKGNIMPRDISIIELYTKTQPATHHKIYFAASIAIQKKEVLDMVLPFL